MIDWTRIRFFKATEFIESQKLRPEMIHALDDLRFRFGRSLIVTSSYREPAQNAQVGGVTRSAHTLAADGFYSGVDLTTQGALARINKKVPGYEMWTLFIIARELGFRRIGIYPKHLHLDLEPDLPSPALWGDSD